jgi:hypothetical protein
MFLSYAHADEPLLIELKKHLAALRRQGVISAWHDRNITAGQEWASQISQELEVADVILLLVSPDFIASDYCWGVEVKRALERYEVGETLVIPVILRPCDWKYLPFGKLQGLPTDARPVTGPSWSSRDEAFAVVATGIRATVAGWLPPETVVAPRQQTGKVASSVYDVSSQTVPGYRLPKSLTTNFNPYQASRDVLAYLEVELASRMALLEKAGYVVDHDQRAGKVRFRVETGGRTVYFLDMWQGGLGNDKGISFYHGWGNRLSTEGSMTATASAVPDDYIDEPRLDVINMSLLGHGTTKRLYSKEEFVEALWEQVVTTVDQLGR